MFTYLQADKTTTWRIKLRENKSTLITLSTRNNIKMYRIEWNYFKRNNKIKYFIKTLVARIKCVFKPNTLHKRSLGCMAESRNSHFETMYSII